jgi:hypothetical protein
MVKRRLAHLWRIQVSNLFAAEFKIIEKPVLDKLNLSIKHINSAVARVLYACDGLIDTAEQELRAHLTHHPDEKQRRIYPKQSNPGEVSEALSDLL